MSCSYDIDVSMEDMKPSRVPVGTVRLHFSTTIMSTTLARANVLISDLCMENIQ